LYGYAVTGQFIFAESLMICLTPSSRSIKSRSQKAFALALMMPWRINHHDGTFIHCLTRVSRGPIDTEFIRPGHTVEHIHFSPLCSVKSEVGRPVQYRARKRQRKKATHRCASASSCVNHMEGLTDALHHHAFRSFFWSTGFSRSPAS
jgi:hypothetical protein